MVVIGRTFNCCFYALKAFKEVLLQDLLVGHSTDQSHAVKSNCSSDSEGISF